MAQNKGNDTDEKKDANNVENDEPRLLSVNKLINDRRTFYIDSAKKVQFMQDFNALVNKHAAVYGSNSFANLKNSAVKPQFTVIYSRGFTVHQLNDIYKSKAQITDMILDNLTVNADGSISGHGVSVANGQLTVTDKDVNVKDFAPKFMKAGIKYVGFTLYQTSWAVIQTLIANNTTAALYANLGVLIKETGINTFDSDFEGYFSQAMINTHVEFFSQLHLKFGIDLLTCAPYQFWAINSWIAVAIGIFAKTKKLVFRKWNLQTYSGGTGNTAEQWYNAIVQSSNYTRMGVNSLDEVKDYIVTLVSTESGDGGNVFDFTSDGSSIIKMMNFLRTGHNTLGGCGIWQFFTCYDSNKASETVNWYSLYAAALQQGLVARDQLSAFLQHYQGIWTCISQGKASYGFTYSIFDDNLLVYNNGGGNIGMATISNVTSTGDGFTWGGQWTHKINPMTGVDHDSYDGGIDWQKFWAVNK